MFVTDDDGRTDAGYLHINYKLTYDAGELIIYSSVSSEDSDQPGHQKFITDCSRW